MKILVKESHPTPPNKHFPNKPYFYVGHFHTDDGRHLLTVQSSAGILWVDLDAQCEVL